MNFYLDCLKSLDENEEKCVQQDDGYQIQFQLCHVCVDTNQGATDILAPPRTKK